MWTNNWSVNYKNMFRCSKDLQNTLLIPRIARMFSLRYQNYKSFVKMISFIIFTGNSFCITEAVASFLMTHSTVIITKTRFAFSSIPAVTVITCAAFFAVISCGVWLAFRTSWFLDTCAVAITLTERTTGEVPMIIRTNTRVSRIICNIYNKTIMIDQCNI